MSQTATANTISFQYGAPTGKPNPNNIITVSANGQDIRIEQDGPPSDLSNVGLFTLNFGGQFCLLSLYYDGTGFGIPQLSNGNSLMTLFVLQDGVNNQFNVYMQSDPSVVGTVMINFSVTDSQIGVVIVGTSGLTDPNL